MSIGEVLILLVTLPLAFTVLPWATEPKQNHKLGRLNVIGKLYTHIWLSELLPLKGAKRTWVMIKKEVPIFFKVAYSNSLWGSPDAFNNLITAAHCEGPNNKCKAKTIIQDSGCMLFYHALV